MLLEEGRGKTLFTLTGQCTAGRFAELKPTFDKVLSSYATSAK